MRSALLLLTLLGACTSAKAFDPFGSDAQPTVIRDASPASDARAPDGSAPDADLPDNGVPEVGCGATSGVACPDGQPCMFSGDCVVGSICNTPDDPFFDPNDTPGVCSKLVCDSDRDCRNGKFCSIERVCEERVCERDDQCAGGEMCSAGRCVPPPDPTAAVACAVIERVSAVRIGQSFALEGIVRDPGGNVMTGAELMWRSSEPGVVGVNGSTGTALAAGTAALTAHVAANMRVMCSGRVFVRSFEAANPADTRVVVMREDDFFFGGLTVTLQLASGVVRTATTGTLTGVAAFPGVMEPIQSVSVTALDDAVTVMDPGSRDILIVIPRHAGVTQAGGIRGAVDVSATRTGDFKLGFVGAPVPSNLMDFDADVFIKDPQPTIIDAPQLGLMNQEVQLSGSIVLGLGNQPFTVNDTRCGGVAPGTQEIGCFAVQLPPGPSLAWTLSGRLRLQELAGIAGRLTGLFMEGSETPTGDMMVEMAPLLRRFRHGVFNGLDTTPVDKVSFATGMATPACSNADTPDYARQCRPDFARFTPLTMQAAVAQAVDTVVTIPPLPRQSAGGFAGGVMVLPVAITPTRGLVPLGLGMGRDTRAESEVADGRVNGAERPFGPFSDTLPDGKLAVSSAVPHGGLEGSPLALIAIARDLQPGTDSAHVSGIVHRVRAFGATVDLAAATFPAFPSGTFDRTRGVLTTPGAPSMMMSRVRIRRGGATWWVFAPAAQGTLTLPSLPAARTFLDGPTPPALRVSLVRSAVPYSAAFELGSGTNLDRPFELITGFASTECKVDPLAACQIR